MLAALLHDVVDDTRVSLEEVRAEFGPRIARIVGQVAQLSTTTQLLRRRRRTHVRTPHLTPEKQHLLILQHRDSRCRSMPRQEGAVCACFLHMLYP